MANISVSPSILNFLKNLEQNNNRDWFNDNKKQFKTVEKEVKLFFSAVKDNLTKHDDVDGLKVFRIYRDVRFSKNKAPYKTNFGCSFHRVKPKLRGGYYVHLQPNDQSFIATGFWEPNKEDLHRIRKEFEIDATEMRDILNLETLKSNWGNLEGDELKTAPKGFDKEHPAIDLIRKKQYLFIKKYTDKEVLAPDFITNIDEAFKAIRPYFNYMSDVLTTDLNGVSLI
ncbi:MAG: DUF2461 domain-containing protein [Flavobacteriaceae bacterium]